MTQAIRTPLNEAQLLVLQLVNKNYNEQELEELRALLIEFNQRRMQKSLEKTIESKGYTEEDFTSMLKGHNRTLAKNA